MNRQDWETQVFKSDMNTTARLVALVVGSFGNWTDDRNVWPSNKAIADMAGMTRGTVQRYMEAFVEQGWLTLVKVREKNVKEYELSVPAFEPTGCLAPVSRGNQHTKQQLLNHATTTEKQLSNQAEPVVESSNIQLSNGATPVVASCDTNLKEPKEEPTREHKEDVPVADAPDPSPSLNLELEEGLEDTTSPKLEITDPTLITRLRIAFNIYKNKNPESEIWEKVWDLCLSADYSPETQNERDAAKRVHYAKSFVEGEAEW